MPMPPEDIISLLDTLLEPVIVADENMLIVESNAAFSDVFGYSYSEIQGQSVQTLVVDEQRERHAAFFRDYMRGGRDAIVSLVQSLKAKSGALIPVKLGLSRSITVGGHAPARLLHCKRELSRSPQKKTGLIRRGSFWSCTLVFPPVPTWSLQVMAHLGRCKILR